MATDDDILAIIASKKMAVLTFSRVGIFFHRFFFACVQKILQTKNVIVCERLTKNAVGWKTEKIFFDYEKKILLKDD